MPGVSRLVLVGGGIGVLMFVLREVNVILGIGGGLGLYAVGILFAHVLSDDDWDLLYRIVSAMPGGAFVLRYWKRDVQLNW